MSEFYKMDPGAWDYGTAGLTLEQEAAYLRIVNAMHKHKSGVPDLNRVLAGMFRCSPRKARALVLALQKAGKIQIEDGLITNKRAISDLVHRGFVTISRAENGAKGGRKRADNAAKSRETKETPQAIASSREEKSREDTDTKVSGYADVSQILWSKGVAHLVKGGRSETQARSVIGRWRKHHSDETILAALGKSQREGSMDPVAFCEGVFRHDAKAAAKPQGGSQRTTPDGRQQVWQPGEGWVTEHV